VPLYCSLVRYSLLSSAFPLKGFALASYCRFLNDRADLIILVEEPDGQQRLLPLQEAFELMLQSGVAMPRFLVYAHLKRAGHLVKR
jgi:hypothetical protein